MKKLLLLAVLFAAGCTPVAEVEPEPPALWNVKVYSGGKQVMLFSTREEPYLRSSESCTWYFPERDWTISGLGVIIQKTDDPHEDHYQKPQEAE